MKIFIFLLFLIGFYVSSNGQKQLFDSIEKKYRFVTPGILKAVSYSNTHMKNISSTEPKSCTGMPLPFGVMGVFEDGADYFLENAKKIALLSGISVEAQKTSVVKQIESYAIAYDKIMKRVTGNNVKLVNKEENIYSVLNELSEIPNDGVVNKYAKDAFVYQVFAYLMDVDFAANYSFEPYSFNLLDLFGRDNFKILSGKRISILEDGIYGENQMKFIPKTQKSSDYGPALWNPAGSCNFSSRAGTAISAVTIHTVQGSYAGCISWFQNCNASVSAHYVIRSSDGQVTQMVLEADKAWHVGSENPYTIGYEHEGYVSDASWYTNAMYSSSAALSRDVTTSGYGISPLRTFFGDATSGVNVIGNCTKIKGHQHYANQTHTDPGINWDWEKYYKLINNNPSITTITNTSGSFYDTGGASSNYSDDERKLWLFSPPNAATVTLNFNSFNVEANWDYMFIYDGSTTDAPLIGKYTGTNSPGVVTSSGSTILVEFRSDCATTSPGWSVAYSSTQNNNDNTPPSISIASGPTWQTTNFNQGITDTDNGGSGVAKSFYALSDKSPGASGWHANGSFGFVDEDFSEVNTYWTQQSGSFVNSSGGYLMNDANQNNSNAYLNVVQNDQSQYLFSWEQKITTTLSNQRAGMHFFCSDPILPNRGNSYFIFFRDLENVIHFYEVVNDVFTIVHEVNFDVNPNVNYAVKVWYNPSTGRMKLYVDDVFVGEWTDPTPLTTGNSISLRTGGCQALFDNVAVYKSRNAGVNVSLGNNQEFRFQSENAIHSGKLKTLAVDNDENWSTISSKEYLIDWSVPEITFINDGSASDIDTTYDIQLAANWEASDIHSSIANYEWALGTVANGTDVVSWTNNTTSNVVQHLLNNPIYNTTYYFSIRATNGAGLLSEANSDGQLLLEDNAGLSNFQQDNVLLFPNPSNGELTIPSNLRVLIYDVNGKLVKEIAPNSISFDVKISQGTYNAILMRGQKVSIQKLVVF